MKIQTLKKLFSKEQAVPLNGEPPVQPLTENKTDYWKMGFTESGKLNGSKNGLEVWLYRIYQEYKKDLRDNDGIQAKIKEKYKIKIENIKAEIAHLEGQIEKAKKEDIPLIKNNIYELKESIAEIRRNPKDVTGDDENRASFVIGSIILFFLTLYLFVFYSSASYSAFFKKFTLNEIGVASSIFDPKAVENAMADGIMELLLILLIPFVFLGLGFLIHKFMHQTGITRFINAFFLITITFIFDVILAYEITEKIYNILKSNSFESDTIPEYTTKMAMSNYSFWLIIFAGFVVYLIWGFIFDFFMEAYGKRDKVKVAIHEIKQKIRDEQKEQKERLTLIDIWSKEIHEKKKEINYHSEFLNGEIIPMDNLKAYLNQFFLS
jgi:hypothetical protein